MPRSDGLLARVLQDVPPLDSRWVGYDRPRPGMDPLLLLGRNRLNPLGVMSRTFTSHTCSLVGRSQDSNLHSLTVRGFQM